MNILLLKKVISYFKSLNKNQTKPNPAEQFIKQSIRTLKFETEKILPKLMVEMELNINNNAEKIYNNPDYDIEKEINNLPRFSFENYIASTNFKNDIEFKSLESNLKLKELLEDNLTNTNKKIYAILKELEELPKLLVIDKYYNKISGLNSLQVQIENFNISYQFVNEINKTLDMLKYLELGKIDLEIIKLIDKNKINGDIKEQIQQILESRTNALDVIWNGYKYPNDFVTEQENIYDNENKKLLRILKQEAPNLMKKLEELNKKYNYIKTIINNYIERNLSEINKLDVKTEVSSSFKEAYNLNNEKFFKLIKTTLPDIKNIKEKQEIIKKLGKNLDKEIKLKILTPEMANNEYMSFNI